MEPVIQCEAPGCTNIYSAERAQIYGKGWVVLSTMPHPGTSYFCSYECLRRWMDSLGLAISKSAHKPQNAVVHLDG